MKRFLIILSAILAAALIFCFAAKDELTELFFYTDIGGSSVENSSTQLNLQDTAYTVDGLLTAAERLTELSDIDLGITDLDMEQIDSIQAAYPAASIRYSVDILGETVSHTETKLDLSAAQPAEVEQYLAKLTTLPALEEINLIAADGTCKWTIDDIPLLDRLQAAVPKAHLRVQFDLFGKTVTSEDTRIEYVQVYIGNEGTEIIRKVLPYLRACEYLLMDGCSVDHEVMAALRDDFPNTKIVWRIWLGYVDYNSPLAMRAYSFLTDTHRIRTTRVNDSNCHLLQYCTETKYVDFGHNRNISDFSFLAYMPKLEVAILALTNCKDLTPLINCPELEYLEVYRSLVTDLSPLAHCTKLKHLNFGDMEISDITCLYGLELERIRGCATNVPKEQFEEYSRLHPDCQMLNDGYSPSKHGWRYDVYDRIVPRYALLREQMEYSIDFSYGIK